MYQPLRKLCNCCQWCNTHGDISPVANLCYQTLLQPPDVKWQILRVAGKDLIFENAHNEKSHGLRSSDLGGWMDGDCRYGRYEFFVRIFFKKTLLFSWLQMCLLRWIYIFLKSFFRVNHLKKTWQNVFIVKLFNFTPMDAKESTKCSPKVNAAQKIFLKDYLWANSKLVERKTSRITVHYFLLHIHCALRIFISFSYQFW